jgi:hypothetical protein
MATTLYDARNQPMQPPAHPAGFYIAGGCPKCHAPILYHGGGEAIQPPTPWGPGRAVLLPTLIMPTCSCEWEAGDMDEPPMVPNQRSLWLEREAVMAIMSLYEDVLRQLRNPNGLLRDSENSLDKANAAVVESPLRREDEPDAGDTES